MKKFFAVLLFLFTAAMIDRGFSWASCGAAGCPIDVHTAEQTEKGMIRLDYSYEYSDQDQPRIGRDRASVGEISGHHDEVSTLSQTQKLGFEAGLSNRWSVLASLPFIHREHEHIHHHMGTDIQETWNFNGLGDLTLLNRIVLDIPPKPSEPRISAIIGGIIPTGRDHVVNADGDEAEAGISPGKSAYSLILGASSAQTFTAKTFNGVYAQMPFFVSSTYQWNGQGVEDYRIGNILIANVGITYPMLPKVGFISQVNMKINRRDDRGNTNEEVEKTGGTYVYYSPGIQLSLAENLWSYLIMQLPIYQRVNSIQLTSDSNLLFGMSYKFSAL